LDHHAPPAGPTPFPCTTLFRTTDTPPVTTDGTFNLSLSGNLDANGTSVAYEVSTDGGATWSATGATQTSLVDGDYRFHAIVTDPARNSTPRNVSHVSIDNTAPT